MTSPHRPIVEITSSVSRSRSAQPGGLHAWVDESGSVHDADPGTYIMSAALIAPGDEDDARATMRGLRLSRQAKLHWRDERPPRRHRIATTIGGLHLDHLVVVRAGRPTDNASRRRNKCLERLLPELNALGVDTVTFESRGTADDRRDMNLINALRGRQTLPSTLRTHHVRGREEPLLWIPDAVCGTIVAARTGDPNYQAVLAEDITIIEI